MFIFKLSAALLILLVTIIAALWPFIHKARRSQSCGHVHHGTEVHIDSALGQSMTSGIFLGAALLHMLPDAARDFAKAGYQYPMAFLITALSFLFFLLLEHIGVALSKRSKTLISSILFITALMLSIHSLLEGAAVGITGDISTALVISVAILAHKGAASFALSSTLNKSTLSLIARLALFSFFAVMTPLGIFIGAWVTETTVVNSLFTPIFSSLAAGTFLYIGTLHGLERSNLITHCCNMKEFSFMLLGFSLMAIVAIWT
jgi:zinc transporter 1/2/3